MACSCKSKPSNGGTKSQPRIIPRQSAPSNNGGKRIIKREIK